MATISYTPKGVCSRKIDIEVEDAIVPVKDFQSVEYSQTVPAPYDGLVDRTSYTDGTVTK